MMLKVRETRTTILPVPISLASKSVGSCKEDVMNQQNSLHEIFGKVIHSYSRADALEDGYLVDVSETAREAGIKYPVAMTRTVRDGYITPDPRSVPYGQSESGRLWDTLWMLRNAARRGGTEILFQLYFIMKERQRRLITLKAICGPGDDAEPVITIMLPEED
jgi:hypothetical protein